MSWQCGEGPYGRYPGEDGYDDDLTRYTVEQIENKLRSDDDSVEQRVILHVKKASKTNKVSWIVGAGGYVDSIGTYLSERVFRSAHVIEIDESAKLIKMNKIFDDDDDVYNICNQRMQFEISQKGSSGFRVPILKVTMDTKKAEDLINNIQTNSAYLVVFANSGPTKGQEPHCSVLNL